MRTVIPYVSLMKDSWAEDLTPSQEVRQKYMFVQCMGHYHATDSYGVIGRSNLHSYLLIYTNNGCGIIEYKGNTTELPKGSSAIIDCDQLHSYYCKPGCEWDFYWTHFSGNCIDGYLAEITDNWVVNSSDIGDVFHEIYDHTRTGSIIDSIKVSTSIINVCSIYLISLRSNQQKSTSSLSPVVRDSVSYFEENITNDISLDDLCRNFNINKYYFSHIFKEQTGSSPYEYLISLRLSYAKSLLRSTTDPVASIAEKCGFNGSSYFIHVFKNREKMTPLSYRNFFLQLTSA